MVVPDATFDIAADGTLTERLPERVRFKDSVGFRPICPFFELHGVWKVGAERHAGPVTAEVLAQFDLTPADVLWKAEVANLKAHHYTGSVGDRIEARTEVPGDDHRSHPLEGRSPSDADRPLVPPGRTLSFGSVQLPKPNADFPELRLRFTPASGIVYGPTDLAQRTNTYTVPPDHLILNPQAVWCGFSLTDDPKTNPGGLFAGAEENASLGLVDDVCDGIVVVTLPSDLTASARIVVGPPDFAPDRRPFVSIADGLTDRVRRGDVRAPHYLADGTRTVLEVRDLFERILETMDGVNVDVQNERAGAENAAIARAQGLPLEVVRAQSFATPEPLLGILLALTERGRRRHRRFVALEMLEDLFREQPDLIRRVVREPVTHERFYDRQMPVGMRGSDRYPMHLTRRQYDLLVLWAEALRTETVEGT
ncbi:hypothetical protein ACFW9U_26710 [Rhodococcus aetherivorans]|uniref:hypothetical protein n=1 Tax=Rhodococcus aetherivorans TaxID=191292 RepID=UPI00366D4464